MGRLKTYYPKIKWDTYSAYPILFKANQPESQFTWGENKRVE